MAEQYTNNISYWQGGYPDGWSQADMAYAYVGPENNNNAVADAESTLEHGNNSQGPKRVKCDECGKYFRQSSISKHRKHVHCPDREFPCKHCGQLFKVRRDVTRHEKTMHAPEISYRCTLCSHTRPRIDNVMRHVSNVHGIEEDRHSYILQCQVTGTEHAVQES